MDIRLANDHDLEEIILVDKEMIGSDRRKEEIKEAIGQNQCVLVFSDSELAGFLLYHTHFFECCFISLVMIKPSHQRKGYAKSLLKYMAEHSPTQKVFSSTNQSNIAMQQVFTASDFIKSGFVDNLDEGDPEIIYFTNGRNEE
ncbi:GNAT family N-acetyltransferase [Fictibacillus nanhaiensis]|uniref:GNAT family N-acetyltransferase n=1 Tax=Fictibacillus nanhaiensis TaxID=742169 RepID=UPI001C95781A|nr:GNAT family N-acetyltransferase [Fictibacillus nanhaiensis]MBY6036793.1 GNAT family N-acetyltransferase [Fictibacillus nanhaiensis]